MGIQAYINKTALASFFFFLNLSIYNLSLVYRRKDGTASRYGVARIINGVFSLVLVLVFLEIILKV